MLYTKSPMKVAVIGGSNSVMRSGYLKYFYECILEKYSINIQLSYFSLGGVTSLFGTIQNYRHRIAENHDVILFEYSINDRSAFIESNYTPKLAGMALEGFIRQAKSMNPHCTIIILIFGTNNAKYYNNCCLISATYESIARRYNIPVINTTEILLATKGIKFIKRLYDREGSVHFSRPEGAKKIGQIIAREIIDNNLFSSQILDSNYKNELYRMYASNLQNLEFVSNLDSQIFSNKLKKDVFKNSLFEETIYTINAGYSLNLQLQGRLCGVVIKSDWYDGLIKIKLGDRVLTTSSFSNYVTQEGKANINLMSLPYTKYMQSTKFSDFTISVCQKYDENYELDFNKTNPKVDPKLWKLSIVGIAYVGKINMANAGT